MSAAALLAPAGLSLRATGMNLEGITHQESLRAPGGGNNLNWIVGHLLVHRDRIVALLGGEPSWSAGDPARYDRGSAPLTDPAQARPLEELRAELDRAGERMMEGLRAATAESLAVSDGKSTVEERVAFLLYHEGYHVGQLGIVRRALGKPGAIK